MNTTMSPDENTRLAGLNLHSSTCWRYPRPLLLGWLGKV